MSFIAGMAKVNFLQSCWFGALRNISYYAVLLIILWKQWYFFSLFF